MEDCNVESSKYGKYIVNRLQTPAHFTPEFNAKYAQWANRILWIDKDVVEGAFQMNTSWYMRVPTEKTVESRPHAHDVDELLGFFGNNPDDRYDLGAEIEFWMEDEMHLITSSTMIFIPAGMTHCPLILRRVDRPIFHFSTVMGGRYEFSKGGEQVQ